jgi:hypothetical protein
VGVMLARRGDLTFSAAYLCPRGRDAGFYSQTKEARRLSPPRVVSASVGRELQFCLVLGALCAPAPFANLFVKHTVFAYGFSRGT